MKSLLSALFLLFTLSVSAQNATMIAVLNQSSTCPISQANLERVKAEVQNQYPATDIQWVVNDMSSDASKQASAAQMQQIGVYNFVKQDTQTGIIAVFHGKSMRPLIRIPMDKSTAEIKADLDKAMKWVRP